MKIIQVIQEIIIINNKLVTGGTDRGQMSVLSSIVRDFGWTEEKGKGEQDRNECREP